MRPQVLQLQHSAGNGAVRLLLQRQPPRSTAAPATSQGTSSGTPTPTTTAAPATVEFPWFEARTHRQLAAGARILVGEMEIEMKDLAASQAWGDADEWVMTVKPWIEWLDTFGDKPLEPVIAGMATKQLRQYPRIIEAIHEEKIWPLRKAYYQAQIAAEEAAEQAEEIEPQTADALRAAYRSGSTSRIRKTLEVIKTTVGLGRNLRSLASGFATEVLKLQRPSSTTKVRIPWDPSRPIKLETVNVDKYLEKIDKLARALSVANLALTLAGRGDRKPTLVEQGMKDIDDVVSGFSDLGTIAGLPPHVSLITTAYIKPALKIIGAQLSRLVDDLHDVNRVAVEVTGGLMYPRAEPGGQAMFDFMVALMRAGSEADAPVVGGSVQEYLYEHRGALGAGVEAGLPTSGWWLWEEVDRAAARRWAYRNRQRLWHLLYGSMPVPRR